MKTRNYILLSVAMFAAVLAGCQKKSAEPKANAEEAVVEKTFYGSTTKGEKTSLASDYNTLWTTGDKIKVYANGGTGSDCTLFAGAGTSYGEFSGLTSATGPYLAVYPSTFAASTPVNNTTATITLPNTQTITEAETFNTNTVPLVAYSENDVLYFQNVGSLLCLSLKMKSGTSTLTKIELKGNDNENLAGKFTVNANSALPEAKYKSDGSTKLTVTCSNIQLSTTAKNFYIFVPAGVFAKGFTATLTDSRKIKTVIKTTHNLTTEVSKGQIFSADVTFATTGYASANVLGKVQDVEWRQLWPDGPKWAVFNVGHNMEGGFGWYVGWGGSVNNIGGSYAPFSVTGNIQYGTYDTAKNVWGTNWMMPTKADFQKLFNTDYCKVEWKTGYVRVGSTNVNGLLVTGKADGFQNSVFFAAGGYYNSGSIVNENEYGDYWCSESNGNNGWRFFFSGSSPQMAGDCQRNLYGFLVRPILFE